MIFDLVINGGTLVTGERCIRANLGIVGERIAAIDPAALTGRKTIDAGGRHVLPGVIDTHLHLQPTTATASGLLPWADGYRSGSIAAAFGGVTTVMDMRIPTAGQDTVEAVQEGIADAGANAVIDFSFHAAVTDPAIADPSGLVRRVMDLGVTSFKFFTTYPSWGLVNLDFLLDMFIELQRAGAVAAVHAEDDRIIASMKRRLAAAGVTSLDGFARVRPDFAEEIAIGNVGVLCRETGAHVYAVHVTSEKGLDAGRRVKQWGAPFYMETMPHYLLFTEEVFSLPPARAAEFVMGPPYRTERDIAALWAAIADGTIDWMGTDHSPYTRAQKTEVLHYHAALPGEDGLEYSIATGLGGVELLLPIMLSEGVNKGRITLNRLVELLSTRPAAVLGLRDRGAIRIGALADLAIVDLAAKRTVATDDLHSDTDLCLYEGLELTGWPVSTISRGEPVVLDGALAAKPGRGRLAERVAIDARERRW